MKWFAPVIVAMSLLLSACQNTAPTPIQIKYLVEKNNEVVALYDACSEGANYVPEKEGCDPDLLKSKVEDTMDFAKVFISGDIKQPQGYDIYLSKAMIYCRILATKCNEKDYSEQERIARQFFEIQKASSGRSLAPARFYWAAIAAAHASWQWHYDKLALDSDRKTELLLCLAEARMGLTDTQWLEGTRRIRLIQYIQVLEVITNSIE